MSQYGLIFLAGIAASWHCVGMCGGFACALSGGCGRADAARRQLLYNAGRVTTYCFLGAVAGALTAGLCTSTPGGPPIEAAQRGLAIVSGLLILLIGARLLGLFARAFSSEADAGLRRENATSSSPRLTQAIGFGGELLTKALRDLGRARQPAAPLAFGIVNGFLPCPLVYGFLAQAAASGDAVPGMAVMAAFGLGTFPAMLLMGGLGGWLRGRAVPVLAGGLGPAKAAGGNWRRKASAAAGVFFMLFGLVTLARGILPMHSHGGSFYALAGHPPGLLARLRAPGAPFKRLESGREYSVRVGHPGPASGPTSPADAGRPSKKTAARTRR
jgi:sulfite exporter TauE/SafE